MLWTSCSDLIAVVGAVVVVVVVCLMGPMLSLVIILFCFSHMIPCCLFCLGAAVGHGAAKRNRWTPE